VIDGDLQAVWIEPLVRPLILVFEDDLTLAGLHRPGPRLGVLRAKESRRDPEDRGGGPFSPFRRQSA
jgi:hypothetical protein